MTETVEKNWLITSLVTVAGCFGAGCFVLNWMFPWIKYDIKTLWPFIKLWPMRRRCIKNKVFMIDTFEEQVKRRPNKVFVVFEDQNYTYGEVERRANKLGNALCTLGIRQGDAVALLQDNGIDFVVSCLALAKLAAPIVLLNTNQRSSSLLHSIRICEAETLLIGNSKELIDAVKEIQGDLENQNLDIYAHGTHDLPEGIESMDSFLESALDDPVIHGLREGVKLQDPFCYIFTSGTTGLPKATTLSNARIIRSSALLMVGGMKKNEILYTALPLYHFTGLLGLFGCIKLGATIVIREKFSASTFISDCIHHKVAVIQYIGEMCRFLLAATPSHFDREHTIRLAIGNGLRMDIWETFKNRFKIPNIYEYYGGADENAALSNLCNKPGAVGRCSPFMTAVGNFALVEYDTEKEEAKRNANGFCIRTKPMDEGALLIGKITNNTTFIGYKGQPEETAKRIMKDVFKKGDKWLNSGDLFTQDDTYFMYFADRLGDTFRWKGENVLTTEVANLLTGIGWIEDANVYGVRVPGHNGKAGMVAIRRDSTHEVTANDLEELWAYCGNIMPNYAIPQFLRIQDQSEFTSTYKMTKTNLVNDGFDPAEVKGQGQPLYIIDSSKKTYVPLTSTLYDDINKGKIRL